MRPETQPGFCYLGGGLNQKEFVFCKKMSNLDPVLNKLMQLKRITKGVRGHSIQPLNDFCNFAAKIAILPPFQSHFNHNHI